MSATAVPRLLPNPLPSPLPSPLPTASFITELSQGGSVFRLPGDATVWLVPNPSQHHPYAGISAARRQQLAQLLITMPMRAALQKLQQSGQTFLNKGEWLHHIAEEYANQFKQLVWPANVATPNALEAQWWVDGTAALAEWTLISTMKQTPTAKQLARWQPFIDIFTAEHDNDQAQNDFVDSQLMQSAWQKPQPSVTPFGFAINLG